MYRIVTWPHNLSIFFGPYFMHRNFNHYLKACFTCYQLASVMQMASYACCLLLLKTVFALPRCIWCIFNKKLSTKLRPLELILQELESCMPFNHIQFIIFKMYIDLVSRRVLSLYWDRCTIDKKWGKTGNFFADMCLTTRMVLILLLTYNQTNGELIQDTFFMKKWCKWININSFLYEHIFNIYRLRVHEYKTKNFEVIVK